MTTERFSVEATIPRTIYQNETFKLSQPAFLVGNGIYYYSGHATLPWSKLALLLLPKEIQDKIKEYNTANKEFIKKVFRNEEPTIHELLTINENSVLQESLEGISITEVLDLALLFQNKGKQTKFTDQPFLKLKKEAVKILQEMEETKNAYEQHENMINLAHKNNIPILTTNLERNLIRAQVFGGHNIDTPISFIGERDEKFLMNGYFTTEGNRNQINAGNICSKFAIWHTHGLIKDGNSEKSFEKTICLRDEDYKDRISELKKHIDKKENGVIRSNTWVDIFMNNDLVIMGLNLDPVEKDIRWLLIQRHFYQQELAEKARENRTDFKEKQTIFIYRKEAGKSEMPLGKRALFESIGIKCVPIETDEIYQFKWFKGNN